MGQTTNTPLQLRIPGPTPLPDRVIQAMTRPMISHRGQEFSQMLAEILEGLRYVLRTSNDVLLFPASGTGGLEATIVNMLSPGEKAVFCIAGSFGKRWADIATAYGVDVVRLQVPAGQANDADALDRALRAHDEVESVFVTHNETSTGVTNDVAALASVARDRGKRICVDSVSGAGSIPLETDELALDVVVTAPQKAWMAPPGLTMIVVSPAAYESSRKSTLPRWYFDFAREKRYQDKLQTYITPPVSIMFGLQEGLRMIREEGLEQVWERHRTVASMLRAGFHALGLQLLANPAHLSNTVTAVRNPTSTSDGLKAFTTYLRTAHGVVVAGGQDELQGQIFRVGHLGWIAQSDVFVILAALEDALLHFGLSASPGEAAWAADRALNDLHPAGAHP